MDIVLRNRALSSPVRLVLKVPSMHSPVLLVDVSLQMGSAI
jgi:hypothetical protein